MAGEERLGHRNARCGATWPQLVGTLMNRRTFLASGTLTASGVAVAAALNGPADALPAQAAAAGPALPMELTVN